MGVKIESVTGQSDDVLKVTATVGKDDSGEPINVDAYGWVSATTNHYDDSAYEHVNMVGDNARKQAKAAKQPAPEIIERHLKADAKPRQMTAEEVGEYARRLVLEQHPELTAEPVKFT